MHEICFIYELRKILEGIPTKQGLKTRLEIPETGQKSGNWVYDNLRHV